MSGFAWTSGGSGARVRLLALLALAASASLLLVGQTRTLSVETFAWLAHELGPRAAHAPAPARDAAGYDVSVGAGGIVLERGGDRVQLSSAPVGGAGPWEAYERGVVRETPYGREAITLEAGKAEIYLLVRERQGERTWRWTLDTTLPPRMLANGAVRLGTPETGSLAIDPVRIYGVDGDDVTPAGARWRLSRSGETWTLSLRFDDSGLALPYAIDPGISSSAPSPYRERVVADDDGAGSGDAEPVGYWRLGESSGTTAANQISGGNAGTYEAGATVGASARINDSDTAASFDGVDDRVAIAGVTTPATVEAWISTTVSGQTDPVFSNRSGGTAGGLFFGISTSGKAYSFVHGSSTVAGPSSSPSLNDGQPHHLVWTRDPGTGAVALYVDGAVVATGNQGTTTTTQTAYIGRDAPNAAFFGASGVTSIVDEVAIYSVALSASEVLAHYERGRDFGLTIAESSDTLHASGTTSTGKRLFHNPADDLPAASFTVTAAATDAEDGVASVTFGAVAGATGGGSDNASPYEVTYTWGASATRPDTSSTPTVAIENNNANTSTGTFTLVPDGTDPAGGALTVNGTAASGGGTTSSDADGSFSIDLRTDWAEAASATESGLASSTLVRESATLSGGVCGTFGSPTTIVGAPAQTLATGSCYRYTLTGTDNVGNAASVSTTVEVPDPTPTVVAVDSTTTDGTYGIGASVAVRVEFSDAVDVTGTPRLELETGTTDRHASYASGTGSTFLVFTYVVQEGDVAGDLDYTGTGALDLDGGSIVLAGDSLAADLTLPAPAGPGSLAANAALAIDGVRPAVNSISRVTSTPTNADTVDFTVTFSEDVTGVATGDFTVTSTGDAGGPVATVAPVSASVYTVGVDVGDEGNGDVRLDFTGSADDTAGNSSTATFTAGGTYTIDNDEPFVDGTASVDGAQITIPYSETLDAASVPATGAFTVTHAVPRSVTAVAIAGSDVVLTVSPAFEYGDDAPTVSYTPGASPIQDPAGNAALGLAGLSPSNDTASQTPAASTLVSPADGAFVTTTATPTLTATFDDPDDNDTGQVDFQVCAEATCATVVQSFSSATGTAVGDSRAVAVPSALADGTYHWRARGTDSAGLSGPYSAARSFTVDLSAPTVDSVVRTGAAVTNAASVSFTVTFSEDVTGVDATDFSVTTTGAVGAASVTGLTGGPRIYTVTVDTGSGDGTVRLDVADDGSIADSAGNGLAGAFSAGESYTVDKTAPAFSSAAVNGATLTLTYDGALDGGSTPAGGDFVVGVNAGTVTVTAVAVSGSTVTLTLASAVVEGDTVTVSYTPGASPVQDAAGNDAASLTNEAVTNDTDSTPPSRTGQSVDGATLTITFGEALDGGSVPASGDFAVTVDGTAWTVSGVSISGGTVTLTLAAGVGPADAVEVGYTGSALRDGAGNAVAAFGPVAVTNATAGDAVTATANPGANGTLVEPTTGVTVRWNPSTFSDTVVVTIDPTSVGTGGFTVSGTPLEVRVTRLSDGADVTNLAGQLRIEFPGAPADATPIFSPDGTTWSEVPDGIDPLPLAQEKGWLRDGTTAVVLVRTLTFFALSVPSASSAPAAPGLLGVVYNERLLVLRWTAAAGAAAYRVYADGTRIATAGAVQYEHYVHGFTPDDARTFHVTAVAGDGGESAASNAVRGIPELVGSTLDAARAALAARGFALGTVTEEAAAGAPGTVVRQEPAAPATLEPGSAVDVVVAAGAEGRASFRLSVVAAKRLVVRQRAVNVRLALTAPALVRAHLVSNDRIARTKAGRRVVWRMNWWERPVRAGATIVPLALPKNFTLPGRYTLVVTARSERDGELTRERIPVTVVRRAAPAGNAVVVVRGEDLPADTDLDLDASFRVAIAEPAAAFEATAQPDAEVRAVVVDVDDEGGIAMVRQLRLVFPLLRILAVAPAALAGEARAAGANVVVPEPASPELVATALKTLLTP